MSRERRIHARTKTRVAARVVRGGEAVDGVLENVGEGGVFFATEVLEFPLEDGNEVEVQFDALRGGAPVQMKVPGAVLRAERYFDGTAVVRAFAIRFDEPIDVEGLTFEP